MSKIIKCQFENKDSADIALEKIKNNFSGIQGVQYDINNAYRDNKIISTTALCDGANKQIYDYSSYDGFTPPQAQTTMKEHFSSPETNYKRINVKVSCDDDCVKEVVNQMSLNGGFRIKLDGNF